jgi:ABC-2 type transport system permease protein
MRGMRTIGCGAFLVGAVLLGTTGCGSTGITAQRVNAAVAPTFANLYVLQQAQHGLAVTAASLQSKATCSRGDRSTANKGPGEDWICSIQWFKAGPAIPVAASYSLHVQANGCYTAEGDGPPDVNGQPTVTTASGDSVVNPLYKFDGCFDTT